MALEKQQISIDLISGTETKTNNQINDKNQDMVNVVFTGNMTAKKMNGYDLLTSLPSGEYYSSLFTRQNDLLAQSEKGTYKYFENISQFKKIDDIGSSAVDTMASYGEVFCSGTNYNMHVGYSVKGVNSAGSQLKSDYFTLTFTDKNGAALNSLQVLTLATGFVEDEGHFFKWVKAVESNNDFFLIRPDSAGKTIIEKYIYDSPTNTYVFSVSIQFNGSPVRNIPYGNLRASDIYSDGSNIYWFERDITSVNLYKLNYSTLAIVTSVTPGSGTPYSSFKITPRDATSIYVSWCDFNYNATPGSVISAFLIQNYYLKSTLALIPGADVILASVGATVGSEGPQYINYPLTDLTSKYYYASVINVAAGGSTATPGYTFASFNKCDSFFGTSQQVFRPGLIPVSEIFSENGGYYALAVSCIGINQIFHVVNIDTGAPIATMNSTSVSQNDSTTIYCYNLGGASTDLTLFSLKNIYKIGSDWVIPTKSKVSLVKIPTTKLFLLNLNANKINSQIEMISRSNIFNGQPAYYDGQDLSEMGFNNKPFLINTANTSTGGSLSDGTYQILAIYKWKDAFGNVFYSDLSNIIGTTYPLTLANSTTTSKITFDLHTPILSTKVDVEVIIYMKKGSDQFTKNQSFFIRPGQDATVRGVYNITITSYAPGVLSAAALLQNYTLEDYFLYATSTFAAGGDYPTSAITDTRSAAIYEDRVFGISRDNPNSIFYSQQRLEGYGLEFNPNIFFLDAYDKRGVFEDKTSGLISMDGRLFIMKERSILYIVGSGPSRANTQDDLSSPQLVTTDVGCIAPKSLVLVPDGIMFMSDKGIYLLDRKLQVSYIGSSVERFNSNTITSAILLEKVNEVRFTSLEGEVLVYNYFSRAWSWFTDLPAVSACIWKGTYTMLLNDGRVFTESLTHKKIVQSGVSTAIVQKISPPWVRVTEKQGWEKVYETLLVGTYKSEHQVKVSFFYDYEDYASDVYVLDPLPASSYNLTTRPSNTDIESGAKTDGVYQLIIDMIRKNCQAFRMEIEDIPLNLSSNTGESFALSNITVTFGAKKGPAKLPNSKSY